MAGGCARDEEGFEVPTARYVSETYGFSVEYPDTMDVREYVPESISFGFAAGDAFDPRVEVTVESDTAASFEALMERKALDSCLADGPGVTVYCKDIERSGTVRAASRERGQVLYMTIELADVAEDSVLESMRRGPYIGYDLSSRTGKPTVLFVRAATTRQLHETDVELVTNVARSLRIQD